MNDAVYREYAHDEMEAQFNPRTIIPDLDDLLAARAGASAEARARLKHHANVAYGASPREAVDIFPAAEARAPVQIYIHGGYWRAVSKEDVSLLAEPLVAAGVTAVMLDYELCPNVTLSDIVRQTCAGLGWCYRHITDYGGDPNRIHISGSSAGGHLVAMAMAHDWPADGLPADMIKGATAITGVYDTEPVLHIAANEEIRLTPELARANSPMIHPPLVKAPMIVAVGALESEGWRRMSADYYELCRSHGLPSRYLEVVGTHHFSVTETLLDPGSELSHAVAEQMGL